jgi:hypothetical protein
MSARSHRTKPVIPGAPKAREGDEGFLPFVGHPQVWIPFPALRAAGDDPRVHR